MNALRSNNWLAALVVTLSLGLCVAWLGGWIVHDTWWPARVAILSVGLATAGAAALLLEHRRRRHNLAAKRHFEALWRLNTEAMYTDLNDAGILPLSRDNPWHELAERVQETIQRLYRRIHELESSRALLEVRCRRAAASAARMAGILDGLDDSVLAIDDSGEVVLANQRAKEVLRIDADEAETKTLSQLVQCQELVRLLTITSQRKSAGHRVEELEIADTNGTPHWYRATAVKPAAEGESHRQTAIGAVAVLRDVGDQKALQKRNAEFVSSVSHEMKTPLAGIKAYVELLADGDAETPETREEFLGVINSQTDRLQRLVDNLLNIARIEAGVVSVDKRPISLNELLEEAASIVRPAAEAKGVELATELSPMYLGALADRDMLLQAAINLLSNAVKYTQPGGKATLVSQMDGDRVRFEVQDTGVGLSEEDCRRVFEKFYRVGKDREMAPGTGLGLPLAKHIIEDVHAGRLALESVLGEGSTFIVTLPSAGG